MLGSNHLRGWEWIPRPACDPLPEMRRAFPPVLLALAEWQEKARLHRQRAERWTISARTNRAGARPNPVEDFLFVYYPFSFAKLEKWHPACGTALEAGDLPARFERPPYRQIGNTVFQDQSSLTAKQRQRLAWIRDLLVATRDRTPNFGCHGLHEWAMVYRGHDLRHEKTAALRLPQAEIDALVESRPVTCSHFDAFRFFAPEALTLNRQQPTLLGRPDFEQPGCIHANMDLYKWASKSMPWIGSDLLLDCFDQARKLRDLDMRASPYDLQPWGLEPVKIETAEGRREYEQQQRILAAEATILRVRLIEALDFLALPSTRAPHSAPV